MKIRSLLTIAGLASGFALPIFAQQTTAPDPQLRDAFVANNKKLDDALLREDAATMAGFYTEDACLVEPNAGPIYGKKAIEKSFADGFQKIHFTKHVSTLEQYSPHIMGAAGNEVWVTGEWNAIFQVEKGAPMQAKGRFLTICVREGDAWKSRVDTYYATAPPAPAETNTAPTSSQEQKAVDPQVRQQIEAVFLKFQDAYNNRDAATIGALLTQDAIEVRSWQGLASGREAQAKMFEADFATNPGKMVNTLVALYPIGSAMCEIADSDVGGYKNQTMVIYIREGDTWKRCMAYINNQVTP